MELITPDIGLVFWMLVSFSIMLFILGKFAWPIILKSLKEREESIESALSAANKATEQVSLMEAKNKELLDSVAAEKAKILQESLEMKDRIVEEAKNKATEESDKIIKKAQESIEDNKQKALQEMKNYMIEISIQVAEKIIQKEVSSSKEQEEFIKKQVESIHIN